MMRQFAKCAVAVLIPAGCLLADFSYEQTSKMGGAMAGMMKLAGAFSKQAREPMRTTVAVKGDRMVHWTSVHASITDLDKETITEVDYQKKTYSVMTFAEMKQMMEELAKKKKDSGEMKMNISVKDTGQSKQIAGFDTKEMIVKIEMETTDPKNGQKGSMVVTCDMWIAPKAAGYDEVAAFQKRMAEKIGWTAGSNPMMSSEMSKGMAEVMKEGAKLNGMPVFQVISMGGAVPEGQAAQGGSAPPPAQQQPQAEKPSVGGALGGALGGRLGGLGGFGRKKKKTEEPPPPPAAAPAQQQQQQQSGAPGALMEITTEMSGFSAGPADASKFEVPAGFKQVKGR